MENQVTRHNTNWLGFYASSLIALMTLVTFGIAALTPPISGANCVDSCIEYPYLDIVSRFPRDYYWMYPAMMLMVIYVVWSVSLHHYAAEEKKIFSQIGLSFALMSAAILIVNYFVQVSVIPSSLENGETEGIALLTQYNSHGLFIALEEIGYVMMGVAFFFMAFVFSRANRVERAIRWIFITSAVLILMAFVAISISYGINRQDRFEVLVISIDWLTLIITGMLLRVVFRRAIRLPL